MRRFLYCIVSLAIPLNTLCFPSNALAERQAIYFNTFDDNSLADWTVLSSYQWADKSKPCMYYDQPAEWQIENDQLEIEILGPGCVTEIGVPSIQMQERKHYEVSFDISLPFSIHMDRNYLLRFHDTGEFIAVKIIGNQIYLEKVSKGLVTISNAHSLYPFQPNRSYEIRNVLWANGEIEIYIDNQKILHAREHYPVIHDSISGFRASVGAVSYSRTVFDNFLISEIYPDQSSIHQQFLQVDSQWKDSTYDRALNWYSTDPSIGRWGCALTSASMMLHSHGISTISNLESITPNSLNEWLLNQPDGYIGDGHVNWLAISRLSFQRSKTLGTKSLEFSRETDTSFDYVAQLISDSKYPILDLGGHFVYAPDTYQQDNRFMVMDPLHQGYQISTQYPSIQSLRVFTPSNTDLSYVLIAISGSHSFNIWKDGELFASSVVELPYVQPDFNGGQEPITLAYFPKPAVGQYEVYVHSLIPLETTIYKYDQDGEVEIESITIDPENDPSFWLSIEPQVLAEAETLESLVLHAWSNEEITRARTYLELQKIASFIDHASNDDRTRYSTWFISALTRHQEYVSELFKKNIEGWLLQESNL